MITGMFHASYTVSSLERAMAFYGGVLGIEHTQTQVSDQAYLAGVTGLPGCSLLIGFARIDGDPLSFEVIEYVHPKGVQGGAGFGCAGTLYPCWAVDSISAMNERLLAQGVQVLAEPHLIAVGPWKGGASAVYLDPDGLLVELLEPAGEGTGSGRLVRLHHTTLVVSDIDLACETLTTQLGLEMGDRYEVESETVRRVGKHQDENIKVACLQVPNTNHVLELWEFRTPAGTPARPISNNIGSGHLCLVVDDLVADYELLSARGVPFVGRPTEVTAGVNKGARATYLVGPDEVRFELFQRPPRA